MASAISVCHVIIAFQLEGVPPESPANKLIGAF